MDLDKILVALGYVPVLVDAIRSVFAAGGAPADALHDAIVASADRHLSADAAEVLRAELVKLRGA